MGNYSFLKQLLSEVQDLETETADANSVFVGEILVSLDDVISLVERAIRLEGGNNGPEF